MSRRTKIVCTLGPAVNSREKIAELISAGMNVARFNCSHGDWETRKQWVEWIRELSPELAPVAILVDLQGPKFRTAIIPEGRITIPTNAETTVGPTGQIPVEKQEILAVFGPGVRILLGDGEVEIALTEPAGENYKATVIAGGLIKSRQGLTVVGKVFEVPCLTNQDREDIRQAAPLQVDYLALSYVHKADDMLGLREFAHQFDRQVRLIAKIETRDAVNNIESIAEVSDALMVARGDMGLQMEMEEVPMAQKDIIRAASRAGKPVITATQMLESMVNAPRPTRAEATDIANAILDGTDAVMLSGETANGQYPIQAVQYMAKIAMKAEEHLDHSRWLIDHAPTGDEETLAISYAVANLANILKPAALLTTTTSGQTARLVSKFRPREPILCATWNQRTYRQLALVWGVQSLLMALPSTTDEQIGNAIQLFVSRNCLKIGDNVIVSAGVPAGTPGNTNLILLQKVEQG